MCCSNPSFKTAGILMTWLLDKRLKRGGLYHGGSKYGQSEHWQWKSPFADSLMQSGLVCCF